jgi:hypothetical protein
MKNILEILKGKRLLIVLFFAFVFVISSISSALAFSLPAGSHIYHYEPISVCTKGDKNLGKQCNSNSDCETVAGRGLCSPGQGYKLEYYVEFNEPGQGGCAANQCYDSGKCYDPGICKSGVNNQLCLLSSWRNSCGNGIVDETCGEQCEYTGGGNYCDTVFGVRSWYKKNDINIQCGSDCQWSGAANFSQTQCGGFCGNGSVEKASGEQCDTGAQKICTKGETAKIGISCSVNTDCGTGGICLGGADYAGGPVKSIYNTSLPAGLGGINIDSQYLCDKKCKSSGGFCGDGLIQKFCSIKISKSCTQDSDCSTGEGVCSGGEKCDWFNYNTPTPESSTADNQYKCQNTNPALQTSGNPKALPCQTTGGYCGDRNAQADFKEECDNGTADQFCSNNCKNTYCGDRVTQNPNGRGENEKCDDGADNGTRGFCVADCSGQNIGGSCEQTPGATDCADGLNCDGGICRGEIGTTGCVTDGDCSSGFYCDLNSAVSQCRLYTAIFLRDHPEDKDSPIDSTQTTTTLNKNCPLLKEVNYDTRTNLYADFLDDCTGLVWSQKDYSLPGTNNVNVTDPLFSFDAACPNPYRVPTVRELMALISYFKTTKPFTSTSNIDIELGNVEGSDYTTNNCPIQCSVDSNSCIKSDKSPCGPLNSYIYWSSDSFNANNGYAVNFGTGSAEVYPNTYQLRLRCVR